MFRLILSYLPSIVIPTIITIVTTIVYGNYMKPSYYGDYNLFINTVAIVNLLTFSFITSSIVRFYNRYKVNNNQSELISTYFFATLTIFFVVTLITYPFLREQSLYLGISTACLAFFNLFSNLLRVSENVKWFNCIKIIVPLFTLLIILIYIFLKGLNTVVSIYAMYLPMAAVSIVLTIVFALNKQINLSMNLSLLKQTMYYGYPLALSGLLNQILSSSDRYIIKYFLGSKEVGLYSFSYRIGELAMINIMMIVMMALYPQLVKTFEAKGKERAEYLLSKYLSVHFITSIPMIFIIFIFIDKVMEIFFPVYVEGAMIVKLIPIGILFFTTSAYTSKAFELTNNNQKMLGILCLCGILNFLLNLLLIPEMGIYGAVVSTILCYVIYIFISIRVSKKFFNIKIPYKDISYILLLNIIISMTIVLVVNKFLVFSGIINLLIGICVYLLLYTSVIFFFIKKKIFIVK